MKPQKGTYKHSYDWVPFRHVCVYPILLAIINGNINTMKRSHVIEFGGAKCAMSVVWFRCPGTQSSHRFNSYSAKGLLDLVHLFSLLFLAA